MRWSSEEVDTLKNNPTLDSRQMTALLPNRSYYGIQLKRRALALRCSNSRWENWEIECIVNNKHITDEEIQKTHLPHRTVSAVTDMRYSLGGRKTSLCEHCGSEFIVVNQQNSCPKCASQYRDRYNKSVDSKYTIYKYSAKKRGYEFHLTKEFFEKHFGKSNCSYCGDHIETVGFDRVDNSKGYTEDNVVPCCEFCNELKLHRSKEDFIAKMKKILTHLGEI
jgi:predicted Zn-ribbon and HTH transcriptional regulator